MPAVSEVVLEVAKPYQVVELVEYCKRYLITAVPPVFSGADQLKTTRLFCEVVSATRFCGALDFANGTATVALADGALSPTAFTAITRKV